MVIDTEKDIVTGDIGDNIVNTAGIAVRPFWWGNEYLKTMGLDSYILQSSPTETADSSNQQHNGGIIAKETGSLLNTSTIIIASLTAIILASFICIFLILKKKQAIAAGQTATASIQQKTEVPVSAPNYCSNCGTPLGQGINFCPYCGKKI